VYATCAPLLGHAHRRRDLLFHERDDRGLAAADATT